jgi:predicted NAD/FAD-binding protein
MDRKRRLLTDRPFDAAVIGSGWAGLGVSYAMTKAKMVGTSPRAWRRALKE